VKKLVLMSSLFAISAFAAEYKGTIVDSGCGAKHVDASEKSMKCAQACVKKGAAPVLAVGDKIYKFSDTSKVAEHVGHKVTVIGKADGDTITVDSVKMD
jgi:hypothetical protein